MNLTQNVKTKRIQPDGSGYTVAAGTTDVNSDIVDTAGFEGVRFIVAWGAIVSGAVTSFKVQQNDVNSATGMADLTGSNITVADTDDNKLSITDIFKPRERYIRLAFDRGTQNATIDGVIVELYEPRTLPVTQDTTVQSAEQWVSPAEGTA